MKRYNQNESGKLVESRNGAFIFYDDFRRYKKFVLKTINDFKFGKAGYQREWLNNLINKIKKLEDKL